MIIRQSDMKTWQKCPLQWRYQNIDGLPREQSGALTFGSIVHRCAERLEVDQDIEAAVAAFHAAWAAPEAVDPEYLIAYWMPGTSWAKYDQEGERILRAYWELVQWDFDSVLAREYSFNVPIGDGHTLHGTIDKLVVRILGTTGRPAMGIVDLKTNRKTPTYDWLEDDLQFTAYSYATLQPEFWVNLPDGMFERFLDLPRFGEWVQLTGPKRMDAGTREDHHYRRLERAVNEMAKSINAQIFVPNLSGESCRYCEFRKQCGLPEVPTASIRN